MALEMKKQTVFKPSTEDQLVMSSHRTRSQESVIHTNCYILNKVKALKKKLDQCSHAHISYEMKQNKNFVMRLSPAAYELTRYIVIEQLYSDAFSASYFIQSSINEDECQHQVGSVFRVYNKKKDSTQGIYLKFTINFYHTTSTILVNGNRTDIFENTLFEPICAEIERNSAELSIVNERISTALSEGEHQPLAEQKELSKAKLKSIEMRESNVKERVVTDAVGAVEQSNIEVDTISNYSSENIPGIADEEAVRVYMCQICEQTAGAGTIACEECNEWYHFSCAGIVEAKIESIPNDVPFICQFCNDNLLYADHVSDRQPPILNKSQTTPSKESSVENKDQNNSVVEESGLNHDIDTHVNEPGSNQDICARVNERADMTLDENTSDANNYSGENTGTKKTDANKKVKAKKVQNSNCSKKQSNTDTQETVVAQKYYISSLEGKINHLENTVSVLQKALEGQASHNTTSPAHNHITQSQQSHQNQCHCSGAEDIKYKLLENRLLILENHNHVMNTMYMQNQAVLRERQAIFNMYPPQMHNIQHIPMNCAPVITPNYHQYGPRPGLINQQFVHNVQPGPIHIPVQRPVQLPVIPVPMTQQQFPMMMNNQYTRPPVIPVPMNCVQTSVPPQPTGIPAMNTQQMAAPIVQETKVGQTQPVTTMDGEQGRRQQPTVSKPKMRSPERKRQFVPSGKENCKGPSPMKIQKEATAHNTDSKMSVLRSENLPYSHSEKPLLENPHREHTAADFLRIPSLTKVPPDMESIQLEVIGETTRF